MQQKTSAAQQQKKALEKVNAVWIPLRKRLLELVGSKEGFVTVLGTDKLFEIIPDGFEYPKIMAAVNASRASDEFRKGLRQLAENCEWEKVKHAVLSIPEVE